MLAFRFCPGMKVIVPNSPRQKYVFIVIHQTYTSVKSDVIGRGGWPIRMFVRKTTDGVLICDQVVVDLTSYRVATAVIVGVFLPAVIFAIIIRFLFYCSVSNTSKIMLH